MKKIIQIIVINALTCFCFLSALEEGGQTPQVADGSEINLDEAVLRERLRLEKLVASDNLLEAMNASYSLWGHFKAKGDEAEERKWQTKYFELLHKKGEQGDPLAMIYLGSLYAKGNEIYRQDLVKARNWFEKSAQAGNVQAQYQTAVYYYEGIGGERDEKKAAEWFGRALNLLQKTADSDRDAAFWVAQMYFKGLGVPENEVKAFEYYKKSAEKGHLRALSMVALMYREGKGIKKSDEESFKWFLRASEKNDLGAIMEVAFAFREGNGTEKSMDKALQWFEKGASLGDAYACRELALMYEEGNGVEKNTEKAIAFYKKAVDLEDAYSAIKLAGLTKGDDLEEAYHSLRKISLKYEHPQIVYELSLLAKEKGDSELYVKLTKESAENGYVPAMLTMGYLHLKPFSGVSWNPRISYYWWTIAEERGEEKAGTAKTWLLWGGGALIFSMVFVLLFFFNRLVKKRERENRQNVEGGLL